MSGKCQGTARDMTIRLHYHPRSTYSRRVRIALLDKSIDHELVLVDMAAGQHKSPGYLALNPYGRVPTIEHDGFVLYESTAILGYVEAVQPDGRLLPRDPQDRAMLTC